MAQPIVNYHFLDTGNTFEHYDQRRSAFQHIYAELLAMEPSISGRVLDIGCGHSLNPTLTRIIEKIGQLDGVDPFPMVEPPPHLVNRWSCSLEAIPVDHDSYDMAYSYNVVEHVEDIDSFLKKTTEIIKPGAVYWSMSPNAHHPFTWVTRVAQMIRLKTHYVKKLNQTANDYPAYYRVSHDTRILKTIDRLKLPISEVDFYYVPNVQWDSYFPVPLRPIAKWIDRLLPPRSRKRSFIFMFRLKKRL